MDHFQGRTWEGLHRHVALVMLAYTFLMLQSLQQPTKVEEPKMMRVGRAADELEVHPLTVRTWIKAGNIAAIREGNIARILRSEHGPRKPHPPSAPPAYD